MKLLQCKIENFGKLSDVSFDFSEGVNTFCEENGWGKKVRLRILSELCSLAFKW